MTQRVLVVDDEVEVTSFFNFLLESRSCEIALANSGKEVDGYLSESSDPFQLAFVDMKLPDSNGLEILKKIKAKFPGCEVIIMTGFSTIQSAISAIQNGAKDYLEKPFDNLDNLEQIIDSILSPLTQAADEISAQAAEFGIFYSSSSPMHNLMSVAYKLAKKNINIVIEGETGTGKELMSRFIHGVSLRSQNPFVGVNCGAISDSLLESELFGHEKGAFTGAIKSRKGFFELAHNGTLFLDEVGEAPHSIQVKLLRAIETGEFMRVGSEHVLYSNIRFIAATNRSLLDEVEKNHFRSDLLYRLEGIKLHLPSLRERPQDIPLISQQYLAKKYGGSYELDPDALSVLQQYRWPGNIRQLVNVLNQTIAIHDTKVIRPEHLPTTVLGGGHKSLKLPEIVLQKEIRELDKEGWIDHEIGDFIHKVVNQIQSVDDINFKLLMNKLQKIETEVGRKIIKKGLLETNGNRKLLSVKLDITNRVLRYHLNEKQ
ncbi:MAG TPA: sigma-54 dependent transcriptional regulator [Bacillota bacterium]|nr:sigma-54 dependent transcriptional regulator [Bacillota bacterium]